MVLGHEEFDCEELSPEDEEELEAFDCLLNDIKMSIGDSTTVFVVDPQRFEAMKFAYLSIKRALRESDCRAKVTCGQSELAPDVGSVDVEGKEIEVFGIRNLEWFCRAAEFANNTEVYPLKNGKVRLTLGFNRLLIPISTQTE